MMVKFCGNFFMPLEFGCVVIISGKVRNIADDFVINFNSSVNETEIPLSIRVIFGRYAQILRSSKLGGSFGAEENSPGMLTKQHNPIKPGEDFIFYILIGIDRFHIAINNNHFCDYIFRTSIKRIAGVEVLHDVEKIYRFDHRRVFPFSYPTYQTRLLSNIIFSNDNPAPFKLGNVVTLKASTGGNPNGSFTIKFLIGKSELQAFHFDVRFATRKVIRNNSVNETAELLESEIEDYGGFPFIHERLFKIAIGFDTNGLTVSINGAFFCEYPYKAKISQFSGMKIREKNDLILDILEVNHYKLPIGLPNFDAFSKLY